MLHISWQICSNYSKLQKANKNRATCENECFSSHHYVNASSATFELPFTSLNSAPPPLGITLAQKSQHLLCNAASCCWYAQDMVDQLRYSSLLFKRHPTDSHLKLKEERWNSKCRNDNLVVCNDFQQRGWFTDKKKDCVETCWQSTLLTSQRAYIYTNDGIIGKLIKGTVWLLQLSHNTSIGLFHWN